MDFAVPDGTPVVAARGGLVVDLAMGYTEGALDPALDGKANVVRIEHDGPLWGFDAMEREGTLWIVAGGVEDHPLDRRGGSFGYIDSFVYLYRLDKGASAAVRVSAINASAEGVVTPKALLFRQEGGELAAWVSGYGSDRLLDLRWPGKAPASPQLSTRRGLPGINALILDREEKLIGADPLLDVLVRIDPHGPAEAVPALIPVLDPDSPAHPPSPTPVARLGEALFFTTLMAPWNGSEGPLSRFTCETCHFEGQVDGRTHHTGRGEVHATTKPLVGLFNNRPHFSRALDPDLTTVADAEFRVAGALSKHEPWFSATPAEAAWLPLLGLPEGALAPVELRRALMTFLMGFTPRPNPAALGRTAFSALEKEGAALFAKRCEGCHAARLVSDEPPSLRSDASRCESYPRDAWCRFTTLLRVAIELRCANAADERADAEIAKLKDGYETKFKRLRDQMQTAEDRADDEADGGDHDVGAHRDPELLAREGVGDERGGVGEDQRGADALQDPPHDEVGAADREPGAERSGGDD